LRVDFANLFFRGGFKIVSVSVKGINSNKDSCDGEDPIPLFRVDVVDDREFGAQICVRTNSEDVCCVD